MIKCEICKKWFKTTKGYNIHYERMHKCLSCEEVPSFDMNEIKIFITSEIQRILKDVNFVKHENNNVKDLGILPIKPIKTTKMLVFDSFESDKRLVMKNLKSELKKGIECILQKVGSFDDQIGFVEDIDTILVNSEKENSNILQKVGSFDDQIDFLEVPIPNLV